MIELEKTFLAKELPTDLNDHPYEEMIDIYIPKSVAHPVLRLRKKGKKLEITKKYPVDMNDKSKMHEFTIPLTEEEFQSLSAVDGKKVHKFRYLYPYEKRTLEIDVFQGDLKGLVVVDAEFETEEEKAVFETPPFCLKDITSEEFIAGGMICGKSYADVEAELNKHGYTKIE